MKIDVSKLSKGDVLSETSYFTVEKVVDNIVHVEDSNGNTDVKIHEKYVSQILKSSNQYDKTIKMSQTKLIEVVLANPRTAMSIYFQKADKNKTKKAFNQEKKDKIDEIENAPTSKVAGLLADLMDNPILDYIPGEMRVMEGYYTGTQDDRGRFKFMDMVVDSRGNKNVVKAVDSRTIQYAIIDGVRYEVE